MIDDAQISDENSFWALLKMFNIYLDWNALEIFLEDGKIKTSEFMDFYS